MGDGVPYAFLRKLRTRNTVVREFLGEFLGTMILILFGDAAFAQAVLGGKPITDVFAITWGWGIGVMLGVITTMGITGGHVNPAVTVAFATLGKFPWRKVPHFLLAQHLGAFVGSAILFFTYIDALNHFDPGRTNSTSFIWATYPEPYISIGNCFLDQIVGTGLLAFTALAVIDKKNSKIPDYLHPICLGFMICALAMCFGFNCMAPLNPARDFATRLFTAVAGYGLDVFKRRNYWWIGLVPTHLGAIIGAWLYYLCIELHFTRDEDELGTDHLELSMPLNSTGSSGKDLQSDKKKLIASPEKTTVAVNIAPPPPAPPKNPPPYTPGWIPSKPATTHASSTAAPTLDTPPKTQTLTPPPGAPTHTKPPGAPTAPGSAHHQKN